MALNVVEACDASADASSPQELFRFLVGLFAVYVGLDIMLAFSVVRREVAKHSKG
tara:strand:+ start:2299 stop:2463 length:165 start_codon:yes stop_codon:yes gene_type:complete